jgi:hypothetical protein
MLSRHLIPSIDAKINGKFFLKSSFDAILERSTFEMLETEVLGKSNSFEISPIISEVQLMRESLNKDTKSI